MMLQTIKEETNGANTFKLNIDDVELDENDDEYVKFK